MGKIEVEERISDEGPLQPIKGFFKINLDDHMAF